MVAQEARIAALERELAALRAERGQGRGVAAKQWYNLKEAAALLNCKPRKVRSYVKEGKLNRNIESRHILIPAKEIESFAGRVTLARR